MLIKNTQTHFGLVSILLHWFIALLMILLFLGGLYMTSLPVSVLQFKLFRWHKEFGMLVLVLAFLRLGWRLSNPAPSLTALPLWERIAARSAHWLFYFFMFFLPLTGWLLSSAAGIPISFFGLFVFPDLIMPNESYRIFLTTIHEWLAWAFVAMLCLHVGASFKHFLIDKDTILQRMLWP